uniref:Reverse transcriptase domain-containing protein n=1 Tax=Tanacetum cinerariifolium TaxID=118510 RepID=A0A699IV32_TANCI|nr:reverse transcriptase domain-containing protein [Tanacetum cinerariifolium]
MMKQMKSVKSVDTKCKTCGGPYSYTKCPAVNGYTQEAAYATTANPRGNLKAITTQSGVAYDGPTISPTPSPLLKEVERETETTKDKKLSLLELTSTRMTLKLANRSVVIPTGVVKDVFVKVRKGDILYLEKLINEDPSPNLPPVKNKDLKQVDATMTKPSIEEPPEVELKDLPYHLEYAFLEGTVPVIISKELKDEEKDAVLKDNFKLTVQHQRRVNPKIYEVIKKEVIKLLDAELIDPISDSPWVSLVHYVSKKGVMTVVENENNELILTQLVTGWRMVSQDIFKFPLTRKIKRRPPLLALIVRLPTDACLSAYVMLQARSKGA